MLPQLGSARLGILSHIYSSKAAHERQDPRKSPKGCVQIRDKILEIWPEVCFYPYKIGKIFGSGLCENPGKFGGGGRSMCSTRIGGGSPLSFFFFFQSP